MENKKVQATGIPYSRYIASWNIATKYKAGYSTYFTAWLEQCGCTHEEALEIREMAGCGKFELEQDARRFVETHPREKFRKMRKEDID